MPSLSRTEILVITTAQIEADWLRQAVVRSLPSLGTQSHHAAGRGRRL